MVNWEINTHYKHLLTAHASSDWRVIWNCVRDMFLIWRAYMEIKVKRGREESEREREKVTLCGWRRYYKRGWVTHLLCVFGGVYGGGRWRSSVMESVVAHCVVISARVPYLLTLFIAHLYAFLRDNGRYL